MRMEERGDFLCNEFCVSFAGSCSTGTQAAA